MDWRHAALCKYEDDPELFFPVGTSGPALEQIAEAKAVCRRCPVVSECLTWALESHQEFGVAGGLSEDERRALVRRRARARVQARQSAPSRPLPGRPPGRSPELTAGQLAGLADALADPEHRVAATTSGSITTALVERGLAERRVHLGGLRYTKLTPAGVLLAERLQLTLTS